MELRFLEGNFEHGKFKLQMRVDHFNPNGTGSLLGEWTDVPCVKEEPKKWCEHMKMHSDDWWFFNGFGTTAKEWNFCPICGAMKP